MNKTTLVFFFTIFLMLCGNIQAQTNYGVTSKKETPPKQKVKVFPNPATHVVNVIGLNNSSKADIVISDLYGNVIIKHQWEIRNNALNIPISNLEAGIYMIAIRSQEQNIKTKFYKK